MTWEIEFFDGRIERVESESATEARKMAEEQYKDHVEDLGIYYEDHPVIGCREVCVEP